MICVLLVCAAFTLDIFCFIFVPLHWLFFAASTYVLFICIWHTGISMSKVSMWVLLVYTEVSLRLRDLKNSHTNLSHLFAAHCIGYPIVYLGFDATCYFTSIFKLRTQKSVQSENDFQMHLLQLSLLPGLQLYPKSITDGNCRSCARQKDKQTRAVLEKKTKAETEARLFIEIKLAELQAHKLENYYILACSSLSNSPWGKYRCVEHEEQDVLLSALSTLQEKAQYLKYNLSAKTRIKLDLFSALGGTRRQLEIAQGKEMKQKKEISEMKQDCRGHGRQSRHVLHDAAAHYFTKFLNSERYVLNRRAPMYQCLKK